MTVTTAARYDHAYFNPEKVVGICPQVDFGVNAIPGAKDPDAQSWFVCLEDGLDRDPASCWVCQEPRLFTRERARYICDQLNELRGIYLQGPRRLHWSAVLRFAV